MMTAEATREGAAGERSSAREPNVPPRSPAASAAWLLRTAAVTSVAAGILGVVIAPGVAGNAGEAWVVAIERCSKALDYFLLVLLMALGLEAAVELLKSRETPTVPRVALISGVTVIVLLAAPAMAERVPAFHSMIVDAVTAVAALAGAYCAARAPHTRALSGVLCAFAFGALARLGSWELAARAGDIASMSLFGASRGLATASVFFEAAGQLLAVTWLGTRGKWAGQLASTVALGISLIITWSVAKGVHSGAAVWQSILHSSLADAPGVPPAYGLDALATFLVPASLLLGLVAAAQPRQVTAIVASMTLALVSRGAFDAPLCALCAGVAAQWAAIASTDDRAMWRTLIDDRARRLSERGELGQVGQVGETGVGEVGKVGGVGGERARG